MFKKLYYYRFELYFLSLLFILFGSLLFPNQLFETVMLPVFFVLNLVSGILLIYQRKKLLHLFSYLLLGVVLLQIISKVSARVDKFVDIGGFGLFFIFYCIVSVLIIEEIWQTTKVGRSVIVGLMAGYMSIGLVGFFMFASIELAVPNSFNGLLLEHDSLDGKYDSLMYFSYITLLSIGYGEITPATAIAQKAAVLTGLLGNFYTVIVTAVVLEKYIRISNR